MDKDKDAQENRIDDPILAKEIGSLPERINELIGDDSIREFARSIGLSEGALRMHLKGRTPKLAEVIKMARYRGVNLEWLATGKGPKHQTQEESESTYAVVSCAEFDEEYALIDGFHAQVSMGHGAVWENEQVKRKLAFRYKWLRYRGLNPEHLRVVFAKGDSMEPTIHSGDSILVDTSQTQLDDSIYVLSLGGDLFAKRVQRRIDGGIDVISDNTDYKTQTVQGSDLKQLTIVGKVVWVGKDIK
ncbi:LexA family transcriptional regulator [Shewanella sp. 3B26]|uniref:LexA family transcriptional regulator n=1 Tax=Shewanella zhuhaiensis TaxID=2919576 RepID=A0AAJ1BJ24_9GAMM|nr:LexA family transcriptional regulator [Shewanella zhuhaiensis]MCH4295606.1 LexA family transcriptional regulator [Shewanella zhuhaiensis]